MEDTYPPPIKIQINASKMRHQLKALSEHSNELQQDEYFISYCYYKLIQFSGKYLGCCAPFCQCRTKNAISLGLE